MVKGQCRLTPPFFLCPFGQLAKGIVGKIAYQPFEISPRLVWLVARGGQPGPVKQTTLHAIDRQDSPGRADEDQRIGLHQRTADNTGHQTFLL